MRMIVGAALAAALLMPAGTPAGQIHRCPDADGGTVFQAVPCSDGEALELPPLNTVGDPLRPGEKALLANYRRKAGKPQVRVRSTGSRRIGERRQAERCLKQRQQLATVRAKLRRGYRPAEGERLRRRRDDYTEYLRSFCD